MPLTETMAALVMASAVMWLRHGAANRKYSEEVRRHFKKLFFVSSASIAVCSVILIYRWFEYGFR
ncbi:MAG: hypothetical protein KC649_01570 [Candidatus Omnitrophica bacterium]|nr:hypothetical protein [Candidatus Omnitrophota bacterium]